jgi:hypothetical protein
MDKLDMPKRLLSALAGFAMVVLGAGNAEAVDDFKTSPASACVPTDWTTGEAVNVGVGERSTGQVELTLTDTVLGLTCPILRDNTTNTNSLKGFEAAIYDNSASTAISCWMYSGRDDKVSAVVESDQVDSTGTGLQTLTWADATMSTSEDRGYYNLVCALSSQGDRLIGYWWQEV